ncbi:sulfite exporter TauE/SafE family protein [Actinotalea sp. K2]|uniref:urease accessory protein UreH domain-containing protein n=1 Tax=Actinotalea sp. K2 TaxID=2939438 RepID=UPI002017CA3A|nr:sulfite exporter TauE/SafE family protein [Actinotalea sp. K2]MCL3862765.1 sulfite exporter TauE/SafE family protein [Actinotalea sp. K2]
MPDLELPVRGMTCRACEVRVTKALRAVPGVTKVQVSAARGTARVRTTTPVPRSRLAGAVTGAGYELGQDDRAWLSRDHQVWRDVATAVAVVAVLVLVARLTGLEEATGRLGGAAMGGSLLLVVLLGLAAGLSTCMALVGGLVLAVSARHAERHPGATPRQRLRPHLSFNAGRVVGFAVLGGLLGAVGSAVSLSGGAVALLTVVVSMAMVAVGLQLTKVSPRLAGRTLSLPPVLTRRLGGEGPTSARYSEGRTAALGAATFLLPCGFTQAVQLYALSTGSPVRAGTIMALFAVGTMPGLLGIGGLTAVARGAFAPRFFRFAGVAVLAFAAVNLSGALTLLAPGLGGGPTAGLVVSQNVTLEDGVQVLRTVQGATGYSPQHATVEAGTEVRWEIDSVAASCAGALYLPALGMGTVLLEPGVNVLTFTPTEPGRLHYSCAMGMYTGVIDVIAAPIA